MNAAPFYVPRLRESTYVKKHHTGEVKNKSIYGRRYINHDIHSHIRYDYDYLWYDTTSINIEWVLNMEKADRVLIMFE